MEGQRRPGFAEDIAGTNPSAKPNAASLGEVLGFVTEFNANTQIFGLAALTVLAVAAQMQATLNAVNKHEADIVALKEQDKQLWNAVNKMGGLQPGQADNPTITRPPYSGPTPE